MEAKRTEMEILTAIKAVHRMQVDGIIRSYAVGGAVAAAFFLEPVTTLDVDVFIHFEQDQQSLLLSLRPIYDYLQARGFPLEGEYVMIEGWPVQFLPPTGPLVEAALAEAVTIQIEDIPVRVFSPEYLAAIALETGRGKDKLRLRQFLDFGVLDTGRFLAIVEKFGLLEQWNAIQDDFTRNKS